MYMQGKVAYEEKLRLVQRCINGELGVCEAGRIQAVQPVDKLLYTLDDRRQELSHGLAEGSHV